MSARKVGNIGKADFDKLCNLAELIVNSSLQEDAAGWDAIVEFPLENNITQLNTLDTQPIQCFIQVKATDGESNSVQVKLSNMKRFCDSSLPCFFFFAKYNGGINLVSAFLVHVDDKMMYDVLKKIRENDVGARKSLHKISYRVSYSEEDEILLADKYAIRSAIEKYIPSGIASYSKNKLELLSLLGYEAERYKINFKIASKEEYNNLMQASLGYPTKVKIKDIEAWEQRFSLAMKNDELTSNEAIIEFDEVKELFSGTINFESEIDEVCFDCKFYFSPIVLNAADELAFFRVNTDFFDAKVYIRKPTLNMDFISYDKPIDIADLRDVLLLMRMLHSPFSKVKVTLKTSEGKKQVFDVNSNSIANHELINEMIQTELSASRMMQIASYFRANKICKISINELLDKGEQIERMYSLINHAPADDRFLRLTAPDFIGELDSDKKLNVFIVLPLIFSSFSVCLAFTATGKFTHHDNWLALLNYEIKIEKLIRASEMVSLEEQCKAISEHIMEKFENEHSDCYLFNSFSKQFISYSKE
ncbi:hypothetical protein SMX07_003531 [Cronobacter sakazakii]|nr:hypothetical protein [Cronobacter sakazakii]ELY4059563.1 hypothetical protein [Cronobacter sakazakii]